MPTLSKPINIPGPWAYNGDKNTIPDTGADVGLASWAQGWGLVNQLPLTAGGIPPARAAFNGALNALSAHVCYQQSGAYYDWSADLMYPFPARVLGSDGKVYDWVSASGVGTSAGAQDPTTDNDRTWWTPAVTGGDLPEFDGTTIKLINGKYGVPEFTAPTASAPGKAGLVPGPEATPDVDRLLNYLSVEGWRKLSTSMFSPDLSGSDSQELGLAGIATDSFDANTIITGYYHSNNWTNAPGVTGLLISVPVRGNIISNYSIVQIFFSYAGQSSYRTLKMGGIPIGTTPAIDNWAEWQSINSPRPQAAAGVGQWQGYSNQGAGNTITLPEGYTWAYFFTGYNADGSVYGVTGDVAAGRTVVQVGSTVKYIEGFVWRVQ